MLACKNLSFAYTKGQSILDKVSLDIKKGEFIAVAGRNGSGKTTLTRLIMGLVSPTEGQILYKGEDITEKNAAKRASYIGYVFQKPEKQMFRSTVAEEIAFGPQQLGKTAEEVAAITEEVMEKTGLTEVKDAYPLSLRRGLKQRVAIASALAMRSQILILDEPTSGQDQQETMALLKLLKALQEEGMTVVFVTHDMAAIMEYATRVIVVHDKNIAFDGTPTALFTECDDLASYGLNRPLSVQVGMAIPEVGVASTMDALFQRAKELHLLSSLKETLQKVMKEQGEAEKEMGLHQTVKDNGEDGFVRKAKLAPLTKIIGTLLFSVMAIIAQEPLLLLAIIAVEFFLFIGAGRLLEQRKAIIGFAFLAFTVGLVQYAVTDSILLSELVGLRTLSMAMIFLFLVVTTPLQDLTIALVKQCKMSYDYAFMLTAALRFIPDFVEESKAVREAQMCRGMDPDAGIKVSLRSYGSLIQPLVLRSLAKSETMALSLELRGFGSSDHRFSQSLPLRRLDYMALASMQLALVFVVFVQYYR